MYMYLLIDMYDRNGIAHLIKVNEYISPKMWKRQSVSCLAIVKFKTTV